MTAALTPTAPQRTRSPKRSELIAAVLREEIVQGLISGRMAAGDALPSERAMIERFEVARPTFREAMRILEAESLVEIRMGANGGAYVRTPDTAVAASHLALLLQLRRTTLADVWHIRAELEPIAVRFVASEPTEAGVAELRALNDRADAVADDTWLFLEATMAFHDAIAAQAGSETLRVLCALLHDIVQISSAQAARTIDRPAGLSLVKWNRLAVSAQRSVVDLIEARDVSEAETFWRQHVRALAARIPSHGSAQVLDALQAFASYR